ncbi:SAGA-associated factor 29 [Trichonephila inaurata madagascariensis]|uniref:SAGA-associated factor 29 n=1 Tax=Trichonephila inaurata madagascariensis TaxID=2747483 RepID=A0A8X6MLI0_9ARAC|nr:SAGA-associated factor 29 [Trichonephila inaurata madagascariensis]
MSEKDLNFPIKVAPQLAAFKSILFEIQVNRTGPEELAAISRNEAELNAAGKRPKQSIVKTQLAMYKKELNNTKLEVERFKQVLDLVSVIRKDCMDTISSALTDPSRTSLEMAALKEMTESLPLWIAENEEETPPLCGANQPHDDYVAKAGDMVAAFVTVKHKLNEWILAEVVDYNPDTEEYKVQDIDEKQNSTYVAKRERVIPLPSWRANPFENPNAIFSKGTEILALYENTTCFYKGIVYEPPTTPIEPYQICFEDSDCPSGFSSPTSVPQKYVLAYRKFD